MAIHYSIDPEARIVRLTHLGETPIEDYEATLTAIFRSPSYRPGFGFLVDRRRFGTPPTTFVLRLIAFMTSQREALAGARWAVVAPSPAGYGLGRMGQMLAETAGGFITVRVFREIDEAERWLQERPAGA